MTVRTNRARLDGWRHLMVSVLCALTLAASEDIAVPQSIEAFSAFERGNTLLRSENYTSAEAQFRSAISLSPDFMAARNNLGVALLRQNRIEEAMNEFERVAAAAGPHQAGASLNAGVGQATKGDFDAGMSRTETALQLKSQYAEAFYNIGWIQDARGKFAEAETAYRNAIRLRPQHGRTEIGLGIALAKQEKFDDALDVLQAVLDRTYLAPADRQLALTNHLVARIAAALANPFPRDKATLLEEGPLTLRWGANLRRAVPPLNLRYVIRIAAQGEDLANRPVLSTNGSQFQIPALASGCTYQWQVTATTESGQQAVSPVYTFSCLKNSSKESQRIDARGGVQEAESHRSPTPAAAPPAGSQPSGGAVQVLAVSSPARVLLPYGLAFGALCLVAAGGYLLLRRRRAVPVAAAAVSRLRVLEEDLTMSQDAASAETTLDRRMGCLAWVSWTVSITIAVSLVMTGVTHVLDGLTAPLGDALAFLGASRSLGGWFPALLLFSAQRVIMMPLQLTHTRVALRTGEKSGGTRLGLRGRAVFALVALFDGFALLLIQRALEQGTCMLPAGATRSHSQDSAYLTCVLLATVLMLADFLLVVLILWFTNGPIADAVREDENSFVGKRTAKSRYRLFLMLDLAIYMPAIAIALGPDLRGVSLVLLFLAVKIFTTWLFEMVSLLLDVHADGRERSA